jgi:hypothetical protein
MVEPHNFTLCLLCRLRNSLRPVIPDNARILRMTAAAGTELADPYSSAFAHCGRFLVAAPRRGLGRVSVPVWLIILSDQLKIVALVSLYLTNKLILRRPFPKRRSFTPKSTCGIRHRFRCLSLTLGYIPTRYSAVRRSCTPTHYSNVSLK